MCKTAGSRLPLIVYRTSFISTRPWPLVKLVTRPPATAKPSQAEAELCSAFRLNETEYLARGSCGRWKRTPDTPRP